MTVIDWESRLRYCDVEEFEEERYRLTKSEAQTVRFI